MTILRFAGMVRLAPHTPVLSGSLDALGSSPSWRREGFAVPINIMIVDSGGEAARGLIGREGIEYLH